MPFLCHKTDEGRTEVRPLSTVRLLLGRSAYSDWAVDNNRVSTRHLSIWLEGDSIWVEDLETKNGTKVDGEPIQGKVEVQLGAEIVLGNAVHFVVRAEQPGAETEVDPRLDALEWAAATLPHIVGAGGRYAMLQVLVDVVVEQTGAKAAWALTWRKGSGSKIGKIKGMASHGDTGSVPGLDQISKSLVGQVSKTGRPLWIADAINDDQFQDAPSVLALDLRSVGCVAVGENGVLYLSDDTGPERFDARSRARTEALCQLVSAVLGAPTSSKAPKRDRVQPLPNLIGRSAQMLEVARAIRAFAPMPWAILILGETGTGKEVAARAVHELSNSRGAFVALNCGAIPESLAESTLFGHERGAFTGADRAQPGVVERAHGGTLFLDEVGELPAPLQVKLLRLLGEGTFERVGGRRTEQFTGRIVAATHRDIEADDGSFRRDLFHRFATSVRLPPLRERPSDIALLARHLLSRHTAALPGSIQLEFEPEALDALCRRSWPGNVRDLENAVKVAISWSVAEGSERIGVRHLSKGAASESSADLWEDTSLDKGIDQYELYRVRRAVAEAEGSIANAAESLGVTRQRIYRVKDKWPDPGF